MNDAISNDETATPTRRRSGKVRAILAGGIVAALGVGGTLAAWNTSVLGEATFTGAESRENDPVLEVRDSNGNWVTNDGSSATLLAALTLPDRATDPQRSGYFESGIRVRGGTEEDSWLVRGIVNGSGNTAAAESIRVGAWITNDPTECKDQSPTGRAYVNTPAAAPIVDYMSGPLTLRGKREYKLCMYYDAAATATPVLTTDDLARWQWRFSIVAS